MSSEATYEGGCHCGRIRFRVRGDLLAAVECNCSICSKKGFIHLIVPGQDFTLLTSPDQLTTYQFNTKLAKHMFCRSCGIHPFYVPRSDPDKIDVNVKCLDGVDQTQLRPKPFDGKNWEQAMKGDLPWR